MATLPPSDSANTPISPVSQTTPQTPASSSAKSSFMTKVSDFFKKAKIKAPEDKTTPESKIEKNVTKSSTGVSKSNTASPTAKASFGDRFKKAIGSIFKSDPQRSIFKTSESKPSNPKNENFEIEKRDAEKLSDEIEATLKEADIYDGSSIPNDKMPLAIKTLKEKFGKGLKTTFQTPGGEHVLKKMEKLPSLFIALVTAMSEIKNALGEQAPVSIQAKHPSDNFLNELVGKEAPQELKDRYLPMSEEAQSRWSKLLTLVSLFDREASTISLTNNPGAMINTFEQDFATPFLYKLERDDEATYKRLLANMDTLTTDQQTTNQIRLNVQQFKGVFSEYIKPPEK